MFKQMLKSIPGISYILRHILLLVKAPIRHRFEVIKRENINVILDVGAHVGDFGKHLRFYGYKGKIVSFEPMQKPFRVLSDHARKDPSWNCQNCALGENDRMAIIHVYKNAPASSLLEPNEFTLNAFGDMMEKEREEKIQVRRLDTVMSSLIRPSDVVLLKIDAQGYEKQILEGVGDLIKSIKLVYFETSLVQVYKNEPTISEMIDFMKSKDFVPISIELEDWMERKMQYLQVDILFRNEAIYG